MKFDRAFQPTDIEVVQLRATQSRGTDKHVTWTVGYAPTLIEEAPEPMRVILGTLHAGGKKGHADVTVGAVFIHQDEAISSDDLEEAIRECDATETLYDIARTHLSPLLATVGASVKLPRKSPAAEVNQLERRDSEDVDSSSQPD